MTTQNSKTIDPTGVTLGNGVARTNCLRYAIRGRGKLNGPGSAIAVAIGVGLQEGRSE